MKRQPSAMTGATSARDVCVGSVCGRLWSSARIPAAALIVAAGVALCAGAAQAEVPRLISDGTFADEGAFGVAVDQASGDVYVAGLFAGNPVTKELELGGKSEEADESGKPLVQSPFAPGLDFGVAVNPANSDVFVANVGSQEIEIYGPNGGGFVSSFGPVELGNLFEKSQIATDSAGDVYVPDSPESKVVEWSEIKPGEWKVKGEFTGGSEPLNKPQGVAVDSSGNVWVADTGGSRIEELSPADKPEAVIKSEGVQSVALDASGDVFALVDNSADFCGSVKSPCGHLVEYSPVGAQLADVGAGDFGVAGITLSLSMVAVNESNGRVYVTDGANDLVWMFVPPTKPTVEREFTSEVGTSESKLGALIKPGGIQTAYRFEYGATEEYGQQTPFPEGSAGEGLNGNMVWAAAKGLAPGTTYHYRVVATNALGVAHGHDQTFTTATAAEVCPNEQLRTGFAASLPDCRAYELVTPPTKASAQPNTNATGRAMDSAAVDGSRMSFNGEVELGAPSAGLEYVSTRGAGGWSSEDVIPLQSYTGDRCTTGPNGPPDAKVNAYSSDLSKAVLYVGRDEKTSEGGGCGAEGVEVVPGEPLGVENLLLRDDTGSYRLINTSPPDVTPESAHFVAASSGLGHVLFTEHAQLVADAPASVDNLYEWDEGALSLPMKLSDGTPVAGSFAGISPDGSEVFFTYEGDLYARVRGVETVQIDASQAGGGGGSSSFSAVAADGSQVLFTDDASADLTTDTKPGSGTNLYRYDLDTGQLSDLTPESPADVEGVSGISEDGSYVYFVAGGILYLKHDGTTTIVTHSPGEALGAEAQVSSNGVFLTFTVANRLYLYDATTNSLACASCNPDGEPPKTGVTIKLDEAGAPHYLSDNGRVFFDTQEALLPRDTNGQNDVYEYESGQLNLISTGTSASESVLLDASENGSDVFFLTIQKLLPQDTNEQALSIYDARVGGGFSESSSQPCTTPEACRGSTSPQSSIYGAPPSQTFSGAGNITPQLVAAKKATKKKTTKCKNGFAKNGKGRCIKKKSKRSKKAKKSSYDRRAK